MTEHPRKSLPHGSIGFVSLPNALQAAQQGQPIIITGRDQGFWVR